MASKKTTTKSEPRKSTPSKKSRVEAAPALSAPSRPSVEQIQARAYEIFRSGANPLDPVADWFQAERELGAQSNP